MSKLWSVIVDFDGTITKTDADIYVALRLLKKDDRPKLNALVRAYEATEMGLLDYFDKYLSLVDIEDTSFGERVLQTPVRDDMVELIRRLMRSNVPLTIASEGLDVYIRPLLQKLGLSEAPLICNRVELKNNIPKVFPAESIGSCARCLSCKGEVVRWLKREDSRIRVVIIGNGASDICAAEVADAVFARDSLAVHCERRCIPYVSWADARDIQRSTVWGEITAASRR